LYTNIVKYHLVILTKFEKCFKIPKDFFAPLPQPWWNLVCILARSIHSGANICHVYRVLGNKHGANFLSHNKICLQVGLKKLTIFGGILGPKKKYLSTLSVKKTSKKSLIFLPTFFTDKVFLFCLMGEGL